MQRTVQKLGWLPGLLALALLMALTTPTRAESWSPAPWLEDLEQARTAFQTKYASLHWLEHDRGVTLDSLFAPAEAALRNARSDSEARGIFDLLARRVRDGHVHFEWPEAKVAGEAAPPKDACAALGFEFQDRPGVGPLLPDYHPIDDRAPFPAGLVPVGDERVGILRIPIFAAQAFPDACRAALQELRRSAQEPCDQVCKGTVSANVYDRLTQTVADQLRRLNAAGATALMVDLTNNPGGTQWAFAVVQMVTAKPPVSQRVGYQRGEHWAKIWTRREAELRDFARKTNDLTDKARLLEWATEVARWRRDAERPCPTPNPCAPEKPAGYRSLVASAVGSEFYGKPWGKTVFAPAEYRYQNGVWDGPTLVLVDERTGSAAESFAAILQDNHAAIIIGSRTVGSGGGYVDGGARTVLKNSGGVLIVPDHAIFRADGSNAVEGVFPDVQIGIRFTDGPALKRRLIMEHLPEAIRLAKDQHQTR